MCACVCACMESGNKTKSISESGNETKCSSKHVWACQHATMPPPVVNSSANSEITVPFIVRDISPVEHAFKFVTRKRSNSISPFMGHVCCIHINCSNGSLVLYSDVAWLFTRFSSQF